MGMSPGERRGLRREQIERLLSSGTTVAEWCRLNGVAESTMYAWMKRFREEDPSMFARPSASGWIELSREGLAATTALAAPAAPAASRKQGAPIVVRARGFEVEVPAGSAPEDVACVLRAAAVSL